MHRSIYIARVRTYCLYSSSMQIQVLKKTCIKKISNSHLTICKDIGEVEALLEAKEKEFLKDKETSEGMTKYYTS